MKMIETFKNNYPENRCCDEYLVRFDKYEEDKLSELENSVIQIKPETYKK